MTSIFCNLARLSNRSKESGPKLCESRSARCNPEGLRVLTIDAKALLAGPLTGTTGAPRSCSLLSAEGKSSGASSDTYTFEKGWLFCACLNAATGLPSIKSDPPLIFDFPGPLKTSTKVQCVYFFLVLPDIWT